MDMAVPKRVHMSWPAKGWISNMLVHSCGLQHKAWWVGGWVAWARPKAEPQARCQRTGARCKNNSCLACSLGIPVTDRLLYKFASGDPLLHATTSIRFTIFMILAAECAYVHRHGVQDSNLADRHSKCNDQQTIF